MNPCDRCEICVGKPTIPEDCRQGTIYDGGTPPPDAAPPPPPDGGYDAPPPPQCTGGIACVPGPNAMCPAGTGCLYGCCTAVIP